MADIEKNVTAIKAISDEDCLKDRKYWCFLVSSGVTFLVALFAVLLWRVFAFICCRKKTSASGQETSKSKVPANKQGDNNGQDVTEIGFMTEAKDWAGELISGQTTTGRILV
ncbi:Calcium-activated potassium channel slowpoke, partial [Stegodyphus mimosarum]